MNIDARGTHRVKKQYTLIGPRGQVPVPDEGAADVVPELLEDVEQAGGQRDAGRDAEAEAAGLAGPVVGVLPNDDDPDL